MKEKKLSLFFLDAKINKLLSCAFFLLVSYLCLNLSRQFVWAQYGECSTNSDCAAKYCGSCPGDASYCSNTYCTSTCSSGVCSPDNGCTPSCPAGYTEVSPGTPGATSRTCNSCSNTIWCQNPVPPPKVCDPPENTVCVGSPTYADNNGSLICNGTKNRTCDPLLAGNYCFGTKYADSCGEMTCDGTKPVINGDWTAWSECDNCTQIRTCQTASCGTQNCSPAGSTQTQACTGTKNSPLDPDPTCSSCYATDTTLPNGSCGTHVCAKSALPEGVCPLTCHTDNQTVPDGNCGTIPCPANAPAAQSCPLTCHTDNQTVPDGNCGTIPCPANAPAAQSCPVACHTNTINVPDGACGQNSCPSNAPTEDDCPSACDYGGGNVDDGSCGSKSCSATGACITYSSMLVKNSADSVVVAESGNRNQICQTDFMTGDSHDRKSTFSITVNNSYGGNRIDTVKIRLGSVMTATAMNLATTAPSSTISGGGATFYSSVATSVSGNNRTVEFPILFPEDFTSGNYNIEVYAEDNFGRMINSDGTWANTGRTFKIWDCKVPVRGTLYDSSSGVQYSMVGGENMNFKSLIYDDLGTTNTEWSMNTVMNPATYLSGTSPITWGYDQVKAILNDDLAVTELTMRVIDLGVGTTHAVTSSLEFDVNNSFVSPYSDSPALQIDFSATADQSPWFQARGGGIVSRTSITNEIPTTCTLDTNCSSIAAMSVSSSDIGTNNNGLVSAPNLSNIGCNENCKFGIPNNWSVQSNVLSDRFDYNYFYNQYYLKHNEGKFYNQGVGMSSVVNDVGGTGVVFINGNLNIDIDNTSKPGKILMLIVKGDVNIDQSVNNFWGMIVADGKITASDASDTQLKIEGILYSTRNIEFDRGYTIKNKNNTSPSVIVKYQPGFLFALPGKLTKIISGWAQGR